MNPHTKIADWPVLSLLFVAFIFCNACFGWRQEELGFENELLDGKFRYKPGEVVTLMANLGEEGRNIYAATELTLDMLFPMVYGGIIAILMLRLFAIGSGRKLLILPLISVVADVLENTTIVFLALGFLFPDPPLPPTLAFASLASFAAACTSTKWTMLLLSLVTISILAMRRLRTPHPPAEEMKS